jgi:hypothetical protein
MTERGSTGDEVGLAYEAVKTMLTSSPEVTGYVGDRVYEDLAPADAVYPFVVFSLSTTDDLYVIGGYRVWASIEILAKVYARCDTYEPLRPIVRAVDGAFSMATVATTGGDVMSARRTRQYAAVEEYESDQLRALGGVYRFFAQSA